MSGEEVIDEVIVEGVEDNEPEYYIESSHNPEDGEKPYSALKIGDETVKLHELNDGILDDIPDMAIPITSNVDEDDEEETKICLFPCNILTYGAAPLFTLSSMASIMAKQRESALGRRKAKYWRNKYSQTNEAFLKEIFMSLNIDPNPFLKPRRKAFYEACRKVTPKVNKRSNSKKNQAVEIIDLTSEDKDNIPEDKDNISEDKDNIPEDTDNIPEDKDNIPEDKDDIPEDEDNIPEDKDNIPEDKDNISEVPEPIPSTSTQVKEEIIEPGEQPTVKEGEKDLLQTVMDRCNLQSVELEANRYYNVILDENQQLYFSPRSPSEPNYNVLMQSPNGDEDLSGLFFPHKASFCTGEGILQSLFSTAAKLTSVILPVSCKKNKRTGKTVYSLADWSSINYDKIDFSCLKNKIKEAATAGNLSANGKLVTKSTSTESYEEPKLKSVRKRTLKAAKNSDEESWPPKKPKAKRPSRGRRAKKPAIKKGKAMTQTTESFLTALDAKQAAVLVEKIGNSSMDSHNDPKATTSTVSENESELNAGVSEERDPALETMEYLPFAKERMTGNSSMDSQNYPKATTSTVSENEFELNAGDSEERDPALETMEYLPFAKEGMTGNSSTNSHNYPKATTSTVSVNEFELNAGCSDERDPALETMEYLPFIKEEMIPPEAFDYIDTMRSSSPMPTRPSIISKAVAGRVVSPSNKVREAKLIMKQNSVLLPELNDILKEESTAVTRPSVIAVAGNAPIPLKMEQEETEEVEEAWADEETNQLFYEPSFSATENGDVPPSASSEDSDVEMLAYYPLIKVEKSTENSSYCHPLTSPSLGYHSNSRNAKKGKKGKRILMNLRSTFKRSWYQIYMDPVK